MIISIISTIFYAHKHFYCVCWQLLGKQRPEKKQSEIANLVHESKTSFGQKIEFSSLCLSCKCVISCCSMKYDWSFTQTRENWKRATANASRIRADAQRSISQIRVTTHTCTCMHIQIQLQILQYIALSLYIFFRFIWSKKSWIL